MDAFFNVYKPRGPTSHDVVARLRRAERGVRRIGHAGTLDPLAEGVLVVATGKATRLIEYLVDADKLYGAGVHLGVETDTYDAEGRVLAERPVEHLTREAVAGALEPFRGEIEQRPPPFSAVSVGGERLYARARRGEMVQAPLRRVSVTRLDLLDWQPPVAHLEVECSKGTYIRSLAHDLGRALGCGAHLSALVRLRAGRLPLPGRRPPGGPRGPPARGALGGGGPPPGGGPGPPAPDHPGRAGRRAPPPRSAGTGPPDW